MASMSFSDRTYRLDKMSLRELCAAYFLYPAIQTYLFFAVVFGALHTTMPTVFNPGYTGDEVRRSPWVARITPDLDETTAARDGVSRRQPRP